MAPVVERKEDGRNGWELDAKIGDAVDCITVHDVQLRQVTFHTCTTYSAETQNVEVMQADLRLRPTIVNESAEHRWNTSSW